MTTIKVKVDEQFRDIESDDVISVKIKDNKAILKTLDDSFLTEFTLAEIISECSGNLLLVNRDTLINPGKIKTVQKYFGSTSSFIMDNDETISMNKNFSDSRVMSVLKNLL